MKKNLTTKQIDDYLVSNGPSYHKYLDRFNEKGSFSSLNLFALILAPVWAAYRKSWLFYALLLLNQILILVFYYLTEQLNLPGYLDVILKILILVFLLISVGMTFFANSMLLSKASKASKGQHAKSSWFVVLLASLLFFLPMSICVYSIYGPKYSEYKNQVSYLKSVPHKKVEIRVGHIKPLENYIVGVLKNTEETIYYQTHSILSNEQIVDAFFLFENGSPLFTLKLSEEGKMLLSSAMKEYDTEYLVIVFDENPLQVVKITGEINSHLLSIPVRNLSEYDPLPSYLHGEYILNHEYTNFGSWLFENF